jgi:outer membrane protein
VDLVKTSRLPTIDASYQANISTANNLTGQFYPYGILPMTGPPSFNNSYSPATGSAASILINWQAITFGQRNAQIDLSIAEAKTKTSGLQQDVFNLKINVISTYLDLLFAYDIVNIQHHNIERVRESLRQSVELTKSGIKPGVDTALFQSELSKAKIDWLNAQKQLQTEQLLVSELIIIDPLPTPTDTAFLNRLPVAAANNDTSFAVHPFIQSAQSQFDFNKSKEQLLKKSYLPRLSVWGTGFARGSGFQADGTMKTWDGLGLSRYNYGAGLQLSFPIMKYAEVKQQLREQNLLSEAAHERLLDIKNTLTTQQRLANTTFNSSVAVSAESKQQLKSAQYAYYAMQIRYNTGLVNFSDLIQAQYNLLKAELDLKKSYWDVWKALLLQAAVKGDENIFLRETDN